MNRFKMWFALCAALTTATGTSLAAPALKSINALSQTLPIEVLGAEGTVVSVTLTFTTAQATAAQRLWLQTDIQTPRRHFSHADDAVKIEPQRQARSNRSAMFALLKSIQKPV
jgi:hypothetical protein